MRSLKTNLKLIFPFLISFCVFYWFPACSGSHESPGPQIDAEIIHGNKEKAFYKTLSSNDAKVILTEGKGFPAKLLHFSSGNVSAPEILNQEALTFSTNGKIITLLGDSGLYEYSQVKVDEIKMGTTPPPPALVEALCTGIAESGYTELHVEASSAGLQFTALKGLQLDIIGGSAGIVKSEMGNLISYQKAGYGTLKINESLVNPADPFSFKANLETTSSTLWNQVANMYCRLNSVPVQIPNLEKSKYYEFVMADSPLSYWRLGEVSGTIAADSSGLGNNATYMNGPVMGVTGAIPGGTDLGLNLPGQTEYVEMGNRSLFNFAATNFSAEMWVYRRSDCGDNWASNWALNMWDKGNGSVGANSWAIDFCGVSGSTNRIRFSIESGPTTYSAEAPSAMNLNSWYHVVAVREGTNIRLFVNGVLQSTTAVGTASINSVGNSLRLGTNKSNAGNAEAKFDEVALYGHALTSAQVLAHYNAGISGVRPSPQIHTVTHTAFVTQNVFSGNFGGLAGADNKCNLAAKAFGTRTANLPGIWRAVASTPTAKAKNRITFQPGASIVNSNGELISEIANDLWAGNLYSPVNRDEFGSTKPSAKVWTGSTLSGASSTNCINWVGGTSQDGITGLSSATDGTWLSYEGAGANGCANTYSLYCINSKD